MCTVERLKEVVSYDPSTGLFTSVIKLNGRPVGSVLGNVEPDGYITFSIDGKKVRANRAAVAYQTEEWPNKELYVDHKNRVRHDNRYTNLAVVTPIQNAQNNKGVGISFQKTRNKWLAQICVNNKRMYLGRYDTPEEASRAFSIAKEKYHYVPN